MQDMRNTDSTRQLEERMEVFRRRCSEQGLAMTHQRLVIYEALAASDDHPTPETIYEKVKRQIPSISLGTIYNNIRTFSEAGLLREVNLLHDSLRLDANLTNHHHLVCKRCKKIEDLDEAAIEPVKLRQSISGGFRPDRFNVEVVGICAACAAGS